MKRRRSTFECLRPELRAALGQYFVQARRKDRRESLDRGWTSQTRGVEEYLFCLGIMPTYLYGWLAKRAKEGAIRSVEAGIGEFVFGRDLLERYLGRLRTDGLRLTYSRALKIHQALKQRIGLLESHFLEGPYDLAISARGAFVYSLQSFAAIEGLLNSMGKGAIAYLDDAKLLLPKAWFRNYLLRNGVEIEVARYERGIPYAYKLTKKDERRLELSAFSSRYIDALNESAEVILEWGFDRTKPDSPMTGLLSSLYEEENYSDLLEESSSSVFLPSVGEKIQLGNREIEVAEIGSVTYVNDAHSSALRDLEESFGRWKDRRIYLIAGGENVASLTGVLKNPAWGAIFFGKNRRILQEAWSGRPLCLGVSELKNAVERAFHLTRPGDVVLFSPGVLPESQVHGTTENRAADFRRCLREIQEINAWR